jgi:hypothetical protein
MRYQPDAGGSTSVRPVSSATPTACSNAILRRARGVWVRPSAGWLVSVRSEGR